MVFCVLDLEHLEDLDLHVHGGDDVAFDDACYCFGDLFVDFVDSSVDVDCSFDSFEKCQCHPHRQHIVVHIVDY